MNVGCPFITDAAPSRKVAHKYVFKVLKDS